MKTDALAVAREALELIAAYHDEQGNAHLEVGTYAAFDEPFSVEAARDALARMDELQADALANDHTTHKQNDREAVALAIGNVDDRCPNRTEAHRAGSLSCIRDNAEQCSCLQHADRILALLRPEGQEPVGEVLSVEWEGDDGDPVVLVMPGPDTLEVGQKLYASPPAPEARPEGERRDGWWKCPDCGALYHDSQQKGEPVAWDMPPECGCTGGEMIPADVVILNVESQRVAHRRASDG